MTLQASGSMTFDDINSELKGAGTLVFPDARTRWLAAVPSGNLVLPTDFYNKQAVKITDSSSAAGTASPQVFTSQAFGAVYTGRVIIACIGMHGTGGSVMDVSAVTIGGIGTVGHESGEFLGAGPANGASIWAASVPSGTSGTVSITYSGQVAQSVGIVLLSVAGISTTPSDFAAVIGGGAGGTSINGTLNIPANGVLVAAHAHGNGAGAALGGVTSITSFSIGSGIFYVGYNNRLGVQSNRAISASWAGSTSRALIACSY